MNVEKCPFCKTTGRLAVFSVFRRHPGLQVKCLVCGAAGPEGDNPDQAWIRWRWAWEDESGAPTTAAEVARDKPPAETCFDVLGKIQEDTEAIDRRLELVVVELLHKIDHRAGDVQFRLAAIERRLGLS